MAVTINADDGVISGSAGLKSTPDGSGVLALQTNGTTAVTVDASQNTSLVGNLTFTGSAKRVTADFTNATVTNRTSFQTSTTNGTTGIYALPNGTSTAASWQATNAADPTNASKILIATNGATDVQVVSGRNGTGTYLPMTFYTNGAEKTRLDTNGNWLVGLTATPGSVGNSLTYAAQGITAVNATTTLPYFQTYNDNATTDLKTWRWGGDSAGALVFQTVNDAYSSSTIRASITNAGISQFNGTITMLAQSAPTAKAAAATLTNTELFTGILTCSGTTYTITLPTGTNIEGGTTWNGSNTSIDWYVVNNASGTVTIGANGNNSSGQLTIATANSAHFRIRRTGTNTFTIYRLS